MSVKNLPNDGDSPDAETAASPESPQREGKFAEVAKLGRYRLEGELGQAHSAKCFSGMTRS